MRYVLSGLAWFAISWCAILSASACVSAGELTAESVVVNLIAEADVPAEEAGVLAEVHVREGQRVKAGEILARIRDRDAQLEVSKAQIALEQAADQAANDVKLRRARQTLKLAKLELAKSEEANQEIARVVSATQIEKLKIDVENAELEIEQAEKELATAKRALDAAKNELLQAQRAIERRRVESPIDGIIVEVRHNLGEWLKPGETVVRVVRDDRLRAVGFLPIKQLPTDLLGRPVQLQVQLPSGQEKNFPGTLTFVSPEANPINGQVKIWAEVENPQGELRAGLSAKLLVLEPAGTK